MPVQRRPAPHQPDRVSDELRQQTEHHRRQAPKAGPFGDGVAINDILFATAASGGNGAKQVRHHLGRTPKGFIVTDLDAAPRSVVFSTARDRDTITLNMATAPIADVTINVWVY